MPSVPPPPGMPPQIKYIPMALFVVGIGGMVWYFNTKDFDESDITINQSASVDPKKKKVKHYRNHDT